jgi:hypothetical protein
MKIRTITQVNSRWTDGRTYAAGEGTVSVVDDGDRDAVAHMRYLAGVGQVDILPEDPDPEPELEPEPDEEEESDPETVDKIADPAEVKDARIVSGDDLDALRRTAQNLGVKVDRRWGADRLRQEIAAAQAVTE